MRARVLLTSPLESFTVGHTLVLSRGFIDVLPDEASLAMALAHELSHVVLGHRLIDTKFAFADRMMIGDAELLATIAMHREESEEAAADAKVVEMLDRSPYKDKLASAGLFLRIVAERSKLLPELIQPHVGDHVIGQGGAATDRADDACAGAEASGPHAGACASDWRAPRGGPVGRQARAAALGRGASGGDA